MKKTALLSELSQMPGHSEGEELYCVKHRHRADLPIVKKMAHTANLAYHKAHVELACAAYSDVWVWQDKDGVPVEVRDAVPAPAPVTNGTSTNPLANAYKRISELEREVARLEGAIASRVRTGEGSIPRQRGLGPMRAIPGASARALKKLVPAKKGKRRAKKPTKPRRKR